MEIGVGGTPCAIGAQRLTSHGCTDRPEGQEGALGIHIPLGHNQTQLPTPFDQSISQLSRFIRCTKVTLAPGRMRSSHLVWFCTASWFE
jgi:hypothetical protein